MTLARPKYSDLEGLSDTDKNQRWKEFFDKARDDSPSESVDELKNRIFQYEQKYKMSTEQMLKAICSGKYCDDEEIRRWQRSYWVLATLEDYAR